MSNRGVSMDATWRERSRDAYDHGMRTIRRSLLWLPRCLRRFEAKSARRRRQDCDAVMSSRSACCSCKRLKQRRLLRLERRLRWLE